MSDKNNPDKKYDFIVQLNDAQTAENKLQSDLAGKTVELKTERNLWHDTGNIVIEYKSYGKPSGIAATQADYWAHELRTKDDKPLAYIMIPLGVLRKLSNQLVLEKGSARIGGENKQQEMLLLKLSELFEKLKETKGEEDDAFIFPNK